MKKLVLSSVFMLISGFAFASNDLKQEESKELDCIVVTNKCNMSVAYCYEKGKGATADEIKADTDSYCDSNSNNGTVKQDFTLSKN